MTTLRERTPFVGREHELTHLKSVLDGALAGSGGLVFVVGEPGIGKTRLSQELALNAECRGAKVLVGRCTEAEGAICRSWKRWRGRWAS